MTEESDPTIWDMLEADPPAHCNEVQDLYSWSLNFDPGQGPFPLFMDLIGVSEDMFGENIYKAEYSLGYLELSKLAAALSEYADYPTSVFDYVIELLDAEQRS